MTDSAADEEYTAIAAQVGEQHQAAIKADLPLFLLIHYEHEADKLSFLDTLRATLGEAGLPSRTYDPAHHPEHGTGKLYGALAEHGAETLNLVTALPREESGSRSQGAFLDYLNLHRDRMAERRLRWVLFLHSAEAEALITRAGDLWDFRHHTYWLTHRRMAGKSVWQELPAKIDQLALPESGQQEIREHIAQVRKLAQQSAKPEDQAALLLNLSQWLRRRRAQKLAADVAFEGIGLLPGQPGKLLADLEHALGFALQLSSQLPEALAHYHLSLDIRKEIGDRAGEGVTSRNLALEHERRGDLPQAIELAKVTVEIDKETSHPDLAKDTAYLQKLEQRLADSSPANSARS